MKPIEWAAGMATGQAECPFYAGSMITDSRYFVGREEVLRSLTEKLVGAQPISVNVVGERRIGKSSLLYHFFLTYEQRVQARQADPNRVYALIYLSLKQAQCQEQAGFYQAVAQKLLHWAQAKQKPELMAAWGVVDDLDRCQFSAALDAWHERGVLPAVCLDEFEEFLEQPEQFDDHFFDHLRALLVGSAGVDGGGGVPAGLGCLPAPTFAVIQVA